MSGTETPSAIEHYSTRYEDSLVINADTPFEAWAQMGMELGQAARATRWWIGDWLVQGEDLFQERYAQAMDATGLEYQTLMNLASVSRRVPPEVRRGGELSHAHHAEVSKFETPSEQSLWLQRAIDGKWTVKELREQIRARQTPPSEAMGVDPTTRGPDLAATVTIQGVAIQAIESWWEDAISQADVFTVLMAGTADDRRALFIDLATRIAHACVAQRVRV